MPSGQVADPFIVTTGPGKRFNLTPAMGTVGQLIFGGPCLLGRIINADAAGQANAITVYDSATVGGASAANQVFKGSVGAGQVIDFGLPLLNGLVVQMSGGAVTTGLNITWS